MPSTKSVTVIGAGMVGTCCGLYLQDEGFEVTLIDKGAPGDGVLALLPACRPACPAF